MLLYHFTSLYHLRGISQYGLTVGDVPTDIERFKGRIGIWLTSSPTPDGHGLEGSFTNKKQFRLLVDVPEDEALVEVELVGTRQSYAANARSSKNCRWFRRRGVLRLFRLDSPRANP